MQDPAEGKGKPSEKLVISYNGSEGPFEGFHQMSVHTQPNLSKMDKSRDKQTLQEELEAYEIMFKYIQQIVVSQIAADEKIKHIQSYLQAKDDKLPRIEGALKSKAQILEGLVRDLPLQKNATSIMSQNSQIKVNSQVHTEDPEDKKGQIQVELEKGLVVKLHSWEEEKGKIITFFKKQIEKLNETQTEELQQKEKLIRSYKMYIQKLEKQVSATKDQNEKLAAEFAKLQGQLQEKLMSRENEKGKIVAEYKNQIDGLNEAQRKGQQQKDKLIQGYKEGIQKLEKQVSKTKTQAAKLLEAQTEIANLKKQLQDKAKQVQVSGTHDKVKSLTEEISQLKLADKLFNKKIKELLCDLDQKTKQIEELTTQVGLQSHQNHYLKNNVSQLQQEVKKLEKVAKQANFLSQQNQQLKKQVSQLQNDKIKLDQQAQQVSKLINQKAREVDKNQSCNNDFDSRQRQTQKLKSDIEQFKKKEKQYISQLQQAQKLHREWHEKEQRGVFIIKDLQDRLEKCDKQRIFFERQMKKAGQDIIATKKAFVYELDMWKNKLKEAETCLSLVREEKGRLNDIFKRIGFKVECFLETDPRSQIIDNLRKRLLIVLNEKQRAERQRSFAKFFEMLRQYKSRFSLEEIRSLKQRIAYILST